MSDHDPFDDDGLEPVREPKGKKRGGVAGAIESADAGESADGDLKLALQPLNDLGNATRLMQRAGDDLMFVDKIGWFIWDGARWDREGGTAPAIKRAHQVALDVRKEAKALRDSPPHYLDSATVKDRVDKLYTWSVLSGNMAKVHGMLTASAPYLSVAVNKLDSDPFLLAAPNGTIELGRECRMRDSDRAERITRALGVNYVEGADAPKWRKFLEDILPDAEMREFVQRIFGYALSGSTREQSFFIFYGNGNNGKSTLMNQIRKVMGSYAMNSPIATFLAKRDGNGGDGASPDLARLPGARLVSAAEPPEGARLDEAKVKEMASGEPMTVRHLNQDFFEFQPVFKAVISTNHKPNIRGTDRGIWRRIRLVPFTVTIAEADIDKELETELAKEAEGILQWMIAGYEDYVSLQGLRPPKAALAAVEDYRAEQDPVGEFLKARCQVTGEAVNESTGRPFEETAKALQKCYKSWCEEEGLEPLTGKTFGGKLTGHGIQRRKSHGNTVYVGIAINAEWRVPL